ncbi:MAG: phosphate acyltransferase PlsX [Filifactoraceae bacterium]
MKIGIDVMGGDNAPVSTIKGAVMALEEFPELTMVLVGDMGKIDELLEEEKYDKSRVEIVHASEVIENEDKPVKAIRSKKDSSMVVGLKLLKDKVIDGFVSAGNTGALLAGGIFVVGRIKGIDRPALGGFYPTLKGSTVILDVGANADCKPRNLEEFGVMGGLYAKEVLGLENPRVALVNIGAEETKGDELYIETHKLLKESNSINFVGNIEARYIPDGDVDVVICDGFTGNIIIKTTEGVAAALMKRMKECLLSNLKGKLGAVLIKDNLRELRNMFDYEELGGAPLLGLDGAIIKAHGSSSPKAIKNAIKAAKVFHSSGVLDKIKAYSFEKTLQD